MRGCELSRGVAIIPVSFFISLSLSLSLSVLLSQAVVGSGSAGGIAWVGVALCLQAPESTS